MPILPSAALAFLLSGIFLRIAVVHWINSSSYWRELRTLHMLATRAIEFASIPMLLIILFYCFSHLANFLSWVILLPVSVITILYGAQWLRHRYTSTQLLLKFAAYRESGQLNDADRQSLADAADALETPFDPRKAEAQILRLRDVAKTIDPAFVMPTIDDAHAQIAYLQSHFLSIVLKKEGGVDLGEMPNTSNPDIRALWELARHKRALRRLPTQLVKEDVRDARELYDELIGLTRSGHAFTALTARLSKGDSSPERQQSRDPRLEGARIFDDAFRGVMTKAEAWRRFTEAEKNLREDALEGRRSKEDVELDIENLRDLLIRRLEEIGL